MASCAPMRTSDTARVNVTMNESNLGLQGLGDYISNDFCYALHATSPNDPNSNLMIDRNSGEAPELPKPACPYRPIGAGALSTGFAAPGGELAMELAVGPGRRIDLIGVPKSALGGTCNKSLSFGVDPNEPDHSSLLIGGQPFKDDFLIRIWAHSPLVNIAPGENTVALSQVVASSTAGQQYLCDNQQSGEGLRVLMPGESNDGSIHTGMKEQFFLVGCPAEISQVKMTIGEVSFVAGLNASIALPAVDGAYLANCTIRPEFNNKRLATFRLVRHNPGTFDYGIDKNVTFVGLQSGVSVGAPRALKLRYSPQYSPLRSAAAGNPFINLAAFNGSPPKFMGATRGGTMGYQRLITLWRDGGSEDGIAAVEFLPGSPHVAYDNANYSASIPQQSPDAVAVGLARRGTDLIRFRYTGGFLAAASTPSLASTFSFTDIFTAQPYHVGNSFSDGDVVVRAGLDGSDCRFHRFNSGNSPAYPALLTSCNPANLSVLRVLSGTAFQLIGADTGVVKFYDFDGTSWGTTNTVSLTGAGLPKVDYIRNPGVQYTVAVAKFPGQSRIAAATIKYDAGLPGHVVQNSSTSTSFFPTWGEVTGNEVKFVKALNLSELTGYTNADLSLSEFSGRELISGGTVKDGANQHAVLYRSVDGGLHWYEVYRNPTPNTATIDATPIVLDYGLAGGKPYRRVGFAILEKQATTDTYQYLIQHYMGL